MMKINYIMLFVFCALLSCKDDDKPEPGCDPQPLIFTSLEEAYDCVNTPYQMGINLNDTFTIISSQDAFDSLVFGDCMPAIDFTTYDLIIGKQGLRNGNDSITYTLIRDCETAIVTLLVIFNQNKTLEAPNLTYHVLSEKLVTPDEVEVEILIN